MDAILLIKALVMGIVEGLTEFLPVSSTGHLILAGELLHFNDEKAKVFDVVIQTGAMLAILWEYRARFAGALAGALNDRVAQRFIVNLAIAFMPAAVLGLAFAHSIKAHLFKPIPVALAFIAGALIILWVERRDRRHARVERVDDMTAMDALKVGLAQAFALIPGTSRSGATIMGGMLFGLSRRTATEFSFFLAVPTLIAAGAYDAWKSRSLFSPSDLSLFGVGMLAAFVSAFLCVRWLLHYIATHDFKPFAWYRIAFGVVVLVTAWAGWVDWSSS
jgi:undecaprenyl-diphosphatase